MTKHKFMPLPDATVGELLGLVEIVYSYGGKARLSFLSDELRMEIDDLGDVVEMGRLLGVLKLKSGMVYLTLFGEALSLGTIDNKKKIIRERLKKIEPFKTIFSILKKHKGEIYSDDLMNLLSEKYVIEDFDSFKKLLIGWGNYTESFEYDGDEEKFSLPKNSRNSNVKNNSK